ncbi:MAG: DNA polymerase III subunit epsilon [Pseudomonadota bacterium]
MRQIVLDTETTGLETAQGNRIIEIGCVELVNRKLTGNNYHCYINPERDIEEGALEVHGLSREFLSDKPLFSEIVDDFLAYVDGAELIIHNAPFDIGFLNYELALLDAGHPMLDETSHVIDSLTYARHKHPGQSNKLDALCKRYDIDNSHRTLHGALLDSEILADVYLMMTGGQVTLVLDESESMPGQAFSEQDIRRLPSDRPALRVIKATEQEVSTHHEYLSTFMPTSE